MSSKKHISPLWTYFKILDESNKSAQCDMCGQKLSYKGTQSNLKAHLRRKHPTINLNLEKKSKSQSRSTEIPPLFSYDTSHIQKMESEINTDEPSCSSSELNIHKPLSKEITPTAVCSNSSNLVRPTLSQSKQSQISTYIPKKVSISQKKKIDSTLIRLFTKDYQPFSVVEDEGFKGFVKALNPSYELPSRKVISNNYVSAAFAKCKLEVKEKLLNARKVCLTTDCWSSSTNESYLALTSHHVSEQFTFETILLGCEKIEGSHTSLHLANTIRKITKEYNISDDRVLLIVSDNACNIVGAVTNELKWKHFGCYAHTVNLIVQHGLKFVQDLRTKGKGIASFFRRSNLATEKLEKYQKDCGVSQPKKVILDVSTRWNSTYYMFERLSALQDAIKASLALSERSDLNLTADEWQICSDLVKVLEPFENITRQISGEGYLTGSQIIVLTIGLQNVCSELLKKPFHDTVINIVKDFQEGIATRFKNIEFSQSVAICTFLDPRFKLHPFTSESAKSAVKKTITQLVTEEIRSNKKEFVSENDDKGEEETIRKKKKDDNEKELSVWFYFDNIMQKLPESNSTSSAIVEVQRYLEERPINRKEDPLKWWAENHQHYPNLASLVKKRFGVVATSVPCERIFSKTGIIINERRTRLNHKKVQELIFLHVNSK